MKRMEAEYWHGEKLVALCHVRSSSEVLAIDTEWPSVVSAGCLQTGAEPTCPLAALSLLATLVPFSAAFSAAF